jgi:hypothetical protein
MGRNQSRPIKKLKCTTKLKLTKMKKFIYKAIILPVWVCCIAAVYVMACVPKTDGGDTPVFAGDDPVYRAMCAPIERAYEEGLISEGYLETIKETIFIALFADDDVSADIFNYEDPQYIAFMRPVEIAFNHGYIDNLAREIIEEVIIETISADDFGGDLDCEQLRETVILMISYYHCTPAAAWDETNYETEL